MLRTAEAKEGAVIAETVRRESPTPSAVMSGSFVNAARPEAARLEDSAALERAVNYVLDDCFFTVGQVVGTRKALDYDAVVWWRDHYRQKFLRAMQTFGNRWLDDRRNVTAVAFLLAERAVQHAGDAASIGVEPAQKAAVDVERYCALHSKRVARARGLLATDGAAPLIAGSWCLP
jgi:hypothetical protein